MSPRIVSPVLDCVPLISVVGGELLVPGADGLSSRYCNLDYAASAPCLRSVADAMSAFLPWYSSVHRGSGFASRVCTDLLEGARESIAGFVRARPDDVVVITRNTTESLNLLSHALPASTAVVSFASEHHANLLPWRRQAKRGDGVSHLELPVPRSVDEVIARVEEALASARAAHRLVAITGASNVTGELFPIAEVCAVARRYGARVAVDAAQLAPHRAIEMTTLDIDYLALSGHKLYAPFGAGVLVGKRDWLDEAAPWLEGGGAVRSVLADRAEIHASPARHEAGTPNVLGAVALGAACRALGEVGMNAVAEHEGTLLALVMRGLRGLGIEPLSMFGPTSSRIGVAAFSLPDVPHGLVAAALSTEHNIGVRDGAFCAHPLVRSLVGSRGGAVRASFGVGSTARDVERLITALASIVRDGPRHDYSLREGRWSVDVDPRIEPSIHPLLTLGGRGRNAASACGSLV